MPVTMPGSASGRMTRKETDSRPKNRYRATANAASVPRTSATPVASRPACSDVHSASCAPGLWMALSNHLSVRPSGGQRCTRESLKA